MKPIALTPADVAAAKLACVQKFSHDRLVGIEYHDPVSGVLLVTVLFADMSIADGAAYFDARLGGIPAARAALFADRALFPSSEQLEEPRAEWPEFDRTVENGLRAELGFVDSRARAVPLTPMTAPPGLDPKLVPAMLEEAAGVRLWAVSNPTNGFACVLRAPQPAIYHLSFASYGDAWSAKRGVLTCWLGIIEDHCVWSPAATLSAHLAARAGRLEDLAAWNTIGGAGAKTSARRF